MKPNHKILNLLGVALLAGATGVPPANAALTHEYSFNDAISSTNAVDSVGGATGDLYPGAYYPADGTVYLDGNSGFVYLPDDIISNYTSVTFEAWTMPASNPTWSRLFDFGTNQGGKGTGGTGGTGGNGLTFTFLTLADGSGLFNGTLAPGQTITGPQPVPGQYHHLVFTIDAVAQTAALYDNGAMVSFARNFTATPQAVGHTFNDYIGRSQFGDPYYIGSIDEFRIYDSPLTPSQVEANYEAGANVTSASPGALNSIQLVVPSTFNLGAIQLPTVLGNYAALTNSVNITTIAGFSSDNTNVIYYGADGNFHAVAVGSATLQAVYQSSTSSVPITVVVPPVVLKNRYSFNGAAGTTAIPDSVGSADGTLINGTANSTLTGGGQLTLVGNTDEAYVQLPPNILSGLTNATFQAWVTWYGQSEGGTYQRIFDFGTNFNGSGVNYTYLTPDAGGTTLQWGLNVGGEQDVAAPLLTVSNEVCVTVSYNASAQSASLFLNGRKLATATVTKQLSAIANSYNTLGQSEFFADSYFAGDYDEFRIYSGAESDFQIAVDAAAGPDNVVTDPGAFESLHATVANPDIDPHGLGVPVQVIADFANVTNVDVTTLAQTTISSSDTSVATVVNGLIIPKNAGSAVISATYDGNTATVPVAVVDTNAWPSLLHRYTFNDAPGSATVADSVGSINGTAHGPVTFTGNALVMPAGNPAPGPDGLPTAASGWISFPANQGMITSLPNEASLEFWVVWNGGAVWQEMCDFGQAATPGYSLGGYQYVMLCPYDGASGLLRSEWDQNPAYDVTLNGPVLQTNVLSQIVYVHDQDRQLDKLYRNGQLVASGVNTALWSTLPDTDNWLARDQWQDPMFNGAYDDFRIWNGSLTAGQVANLYQAGPNVIAGPGLKISQSGSQITLTWPANATGFILQSNIKLESRIWVNVAGTPTNINGLNTLTISESSSQTYYRLKQ
jgi:hypothetical protein